MNACQLKPGPSHRTGASNSTRFTPQRVECNGGNAMISKAIKRAASAGALVLIMAGGALAQTGSIEGTIKLKGADGKLTPVEGAIVDIYRVDINSHWEVKTDKQGHYLRLGMPLGGTFTLCVSGPGVVFTFQTNVRVAQTPVVDFTVEPGDGMRPTYDQLKAAIEAHKSGKAGGAAAAAPDKAKAIADAKEYEAKKKEAEELQRSFDQARVHFNTGIELSNANNYQGALTEFEQAAGVDPTKNKDIAEVVYKANGNLAEMHFQLGVEAFNQKKRDEAKAHFQTAIQSANKAITVATNQTFSLTSAQPTAALNSDLLTYYNRIVKNAALLVEHFGANDQVDSTLAVIDKAEALDAANKNKWGVLRADLLRYAYRYDEATAAYKTVLTADPANADALYGLGLTLVAATEKEKIQEGANVLADFVSKAAATDKRVPIVKEALEAVKNAYKIEAEKPAPTRRRRP